MSNDLATRCVSLLCKKIIDPDTTDAQLVEYAMQISSPLLVQPAAVAELAAREHTQERAKRLVYIVNNAAAIQIVEAAAKALMAYSTDYLTDKNDLVYMVDRLVYLHDARTRHAVGKLVSRIISW